MSILTPRLSSADDEAMMRVAMLAGKTSTEKESWCVRNEERRLSVLRFLTCDGLGRKAQTRLQTFAPSGAHPLNAISNLLSQKHDFVSELGRDSQPET